MLFWFLLRSLCSQTAVFLSVFKLRTRSLEIAFCKKTSREKGLNFEIIFFSFKENFVFEGLPAVVGKLAKAGIFQKIKTGKAKKLQIKIIKLIVSKLISYKFFQNNIFSQFGNMSLNQIFDGFSLVFNPELFQKRRFFRVNSGYL